MRFHHVVQARFECLTSGDLSASVSQSAMITGLSHCAWPVFISLLWISPFPMSTNILHLFYLKVLFFFSLCYSPSFPKPSSPQLSNFSKDWLILNKTIYIRYVLECFTYINSFNSQSNNPMRQVQLLFPSYRFGNWWTEKWRNLPRVTQVPR